MNRGAAAAILRPEEYATEFRKFTAWLPTYGVPLKLIGSGPNGGDRQLDAKVFRRPGTKKAVARSPSFTVGVCITTAARPDNRSRTNSRENEWYDLLERANRMETLVERSLAGDGRVRSRATREARR